MLQKGIEVVPRSLRVGEHAFKSEKTNGRDRGSLKVGRESYINVNRRQSAAEKKDSVTDLIEKKR